MASISEIKENNESVSPPKPAPKKRGRKRKSEITVRQFEEIIENSTPKEKTVSRRGRPRKKVNYYELANPDNADFPPQLESQIPVNYTANPEVETKKRKLDRTNVKVDFGQENHSCDEQEGTIETAQAQNISNGNSEEQTANGKEDKLNDTLNDSAINIEATTSTPNSKDPNKDKKYNYTGETVKMMNTLFNLFSDKNVAHESVDTTTENGNGTLNVSNSYSEKGPKKSKKIVTKDEDVDDGNGNVTCAICNTQLDKTLWSHHKQRYHNNLAWRVGDQPLDLNDQSFVMQTLNNLYKKKKPLYCDKCGEVKKSVVGFLSHRSQCLKSEEQLESVKIECHLCGRKMLPVSLSTHMKGLHSNPKESNGEVPKKVKEFIPSKRSAAKKAMRLIDNVTKKDNNEQYFTANLNLVGEDFAREVMQKELEKTQFIECKYNCNCITTSMDDAINHLGECTEKPTTGFLCKICLLILPKLEEIIYHIEVTHEIAVDDHDEDSTFMEKEGNSKLPGFLHSFVRRTERVLFPQAFKWTYQFCEENFSEINFGNLMNKSDWSLLPPQQAKRYLPKMNESCYVAYTTITSFVNNQKFEYEHRKYKLFESELRDNKITLFCGGSVAAMAWLPTPYLKETEHQILAVSVLNSPDEKYVTSGNYSVDSAIQFWNFGLLKNKQNCLQEPKLLFSLAHSHGPVWHMEWCPSGCYNDERMGLLAVAGSDPVCYIYSIPFFNYEEMGLYYKPRPVMKLVLQRPESPLLGGLKYYPSKISWSKALGHQHICVGYTNGFIALFNLKSTSFILRFQDSGGIPNILPMKCFQAHCHAVTALSLYHLNNGCRWLLSGSFDRTINIWDLENCNYPICSTKKNLVTDGFWLTNWLCYATASDEGSTSAYVTTMLKQVRDYIFDQNVTLSCSQSTISAISGSDWLNGMIHGNVMGEIVALFPHQILHLPEHQKLLKNKRLLFGYTALLDRKLVTAERLQADTLKKNILQNLASKKPQSGLTISKIKTDVECNNLFIEPVLYEEAEQKYYLLFCDNKMKNSGDFPKTTCKQLSALSKSYGCTPPNQYPLNSINKICFNPNRQASLYFATGYQAGFVRISWLEFLKGDNQIK